MAKQKTKPLPVDPEAQRKRRASANRTLTILKAALNRAWREGKITSDAAWRRVEAFEEADAARVRYLTIAEAQRLINASAPDFRLLVRAALATGARYGELASLQVSDFNPDSGTLHIRTSKSGKGRHIVLAEEGKALSLLRPRGGPQTPSLLKDGRGEWKSSHQARPMKAACKGARIEPEANFHCLRHTYASHAIMNGAPLLVVAKNLGHSDTRMVEKHYGHLAPSYIADAIRAAAPKFGVEPSNPKRAEVVQGCRARSSEFRSRANRFTKRSRSSSRCLPIPSQTRGGPSFDGRVILYASMFADSLAPSVDASDLFQATRDARLVTPYRTGYLVEVAADQLAAFGRLVQRTTLAKDQVDISRVESVRFFSGQDAAGTSSLDAIWQAAPETDAGRAFVVWLMPLRGRDAAEHLIQSFSALRDGTIAPPPPLLESIAADLNANVPAVMRRSLRAAAFAGDRFNLAVREYRLRRRARTTVIVPTPGALQQRRVRLGHCLPD